MRTLTTAVAIGATALMAAGGVAYGARGHARSEGEPAAGNVASIDLVVPAKPFAFLPGQLPEAGGQVLVRPGRHADQITVRVHGLPAKAHYVVFWTQTAGAPFGAVQYIGDLTTNAHGRGAARLRTIAFDAFAFANPGPAGTPPGFAHTDLDFVGIWPSETTTLDEAFVGQPKPGGGIFSAAPATPFDDDGVAGPAILISDPAQPSPLAG